MAQYPSVTAPSTRLAALAALGLLLITACGNEPDEVSAGAPDTSSPSDPTVPPADPSENDTSPEESPDGTGDANGTDDPMPVDTDPDAAVSLVIERTLEEEQHSPPEAGYSEGTWTLTCSPVGGNHPDPEAACAEIEEVGTEPFLLDTTNMMCTEQYGGPEVVNVTGHVDDVLIDTEFNKNGGCEIDRFEDVRTVLNP
ncbi:SSI family serine proteinase inhibitor [Nocardiopsis sp. EMB25]|uniref:SSI family serine proteinase inhibitor n=1 Tax=Nocardiopsis sp. EMB25 TaxID=2835867 RepID=UPI0022842843|nr:SSI family serine proteinase inhibitor [Nocardiopsis sp. EMB25]MCY9786521.1 SSI family serine proteinase inhibitor [Nocardiopsis sp. EMB25]